MIDIAKGRYWDLPWSLVGGCTPCSPGCDHCWSASMDHRFGRDLNGCLTGDDGKFNGQIVTHPERLSIPLKRRKPTVWAVWNDLYHESVSESFRVNAYGTMVPSKQHTFLILTKRASVMAEFLSPHTCFKEPAFENIYHGLTVCNQAEADAKIPIFLWVPGKKFLSIEPMLGPIDLQYSAFNGADSIESLEGINAVIVGGETGPGARPLHPDWVRSVRDQCAAAGVPFFFKGWGEYLPGSQGGAGVGVLDETQMFYRTEWVNGEACYRIGKKNAGRLLDGRTHDSLPWGSL
jgi:protein gp37